MLGRQPGKPEIYFYLGNALSQQKKLDEAAAELRQAIKLRHDFPEAHYNLGGILSEQKKPDEAVAAYRMAVKLQPDWADAHYNLGSALGAAGKANEAIEEYSHAIRLNKDHAQAHCNLGHNLLRQGHFKESVAAFRRGHQLGIRRQDWPYPSRQWLRQAEQMAQADDRFTAVLAGKDRPNNASDRSYFAFLCQRYRQLYATAARFSLEALTEQLTWADNLQAACRYNAACCAALAGCGQGKDAASLDDTDRAELRYRALVWLQDDLAAHARQLAGLQPAAVQQARLSLLRWRQDADLACVRDPTAIGKLPEAERVAWLNLWAEVNSRLARTTPGRR
jgi:tetratricopeptide (TPR) repeat protein